MSMFSLSHDEYACHVRLLTPCFRLVKSNIGNFTILFTQEMCDRGGCSILRGPTETLIEFF